MSDSDDSESGDAGYRDTGYTVACPFCSREQDMSASEYLYTVTPCPCGATFKCNNHREEVSAILDLPRETFEISLKPRETAYSLDLFATADMAIKTYLDGLASDLASGDGRDLITVEPAVGSDRIVEVLERGIYDDDVSYGVSSRTLSPDEIAEYGVDVPTDEDSE